MKFVEPPIAALTMMAFSKAFLVRMSEGLTSSRTISTIRLPDTCASTLRRESAAGMAALCGKDSPSDAIMQAMVEAVPITAQCPRLRAITHGVMEAPHFAGSDVVAKVFPGEHRSAGHNDGRDVDAAGTHHEGRRGLIAAAQQYDTVDRVGPNGFFGIHAGQVAVEHGGGLDQCFSQRHDGKLDRKSTGIRKRRA
jgi:hypothetical protein